jgi:hypothetical protein
VTATVAAGSPTSVHDQAKLYTIDLARAKRPVDHWKRLLFPLDNDGDLQIPKFVPGGEATVKGNDRLDQLFGRMTK